MEKDNKSILQLLIKCAVIIIVVCLSADFGRAQDTELEQKFEGFNLQGYDDAGDKSWDVTGDTADVIGSKIKIYNVDANSYGDNKMNVTAETGTVDQLSGDMLLEQDVVITAEEGQQILTDSLDWNKNEDLVTTEDDVMITDDRMTVTGKGLKAQPGLKNAQVNKDVTARVKTNPEEVKSSIVTITSDGPMMFDQAKSMATFEDNVVAVREDLGVENSQTLKADRMEAFFGESMNTIEQLICTGNVVITQGESQSFAEKAVYYAEEQKVVLSGRPKIIMVDQEKEPDATP